MLIAKAGLKNLGTKTLLDDWNNELQMITNYKGNQFYDHYEMFNEILAREKKKINKTFSFFQYNEISFTEALFNEKYEGNNVKVAIGLFVAFDEYIRVSKLTKTKGTISKYGSVKNFLLAFEKFTKFELRLDNTDYQFEEIFIDYCFSQFANPVHIRCFFQSLTRCSFALYYKAHDFPV